MWQCDLNGMFPYASSEPTCYLVSSGMSGTFSDLLSLVVDQGEQRVLRKGHNELFEENLKAGSKHSQDSS